MSVIKGAGLAGLVVLGVIIADILAHPSGTKAASKGVADILTPTYSALTGPGPYGV